MPSERIILPKTGQNMLILDSKSINLSVIALCTERDINKAKLWNSQHVP